MFILNDESISLNCNNLEISLKEYYDTIFKKAINFTNKSIKGHLNDIQDIGAINALINQMSSSLGADQFDVVEIFLASNVKFKIVNGRKTKLGDFRASASGEKHQITVNGDMNPYSFLITTKILFLEITIIPNKLLLQ